MRIYYLKIDLFILKLPQPHILSIKTKLPFPISQKPYLPTQTYRFGLVKSYFGRLYPFSSLNVLKLSPIFISFTYCKKSFGNGDGPTQTLLCTITK